MFVELITKILEDDEKAIAELALKYRFSEKHKDLLNEFSLSLVDVSDELDDVSYRILASYCYVLGAKLKNKNTIKNFQNAILFFNKIENKDDLDHRGLFKCYASISDEYFFSNPRDFISAQAASVAAIEQCEKIERKLDFDYKALITSYIRLGKCERSIDSSNFRSIFPAYIKVINLHFKILKKSDYDYKVLAFSLRVLGSVLYTQPYQIYQSVQPNFDVCYRYLSNNYIRIAGNLTQYDEKIEFYNDAIEQIACIGQKVSSDYSLLAKGNLLVGIHYLYHSIPKYDLAIRAFEDALKNVRLSQLKGEDVCSYSADILSRIIETYQKMQLIGDDKLEARWNFKSQVMKLMKVVIDESTSKEVIALSKFAQTCFDKKIKCNINSLVVPFYSMVDSLRNNITNSSYRNSIRLSIYIIRIILQAHCCGLMPDNSIKTYLDNKDNFKRLNAVLIEFSGKKSDLFGQSSQDSTETEAEVSTVSRGGLFAVAAGAGALSKPAEVSKAAQTSENDSKKLKAKK